MRKEQIYSDRLKSCHFPKCIVLQAVYRYLRLTLSYRDIEELFYERVVDVDKITLQRWVVKYITMVKANFRKKKHSFSKRVIRRRHGNTVDYERYSKIITLADSIVVMNDYLVMGELPNTRDYTEMSEGIWNSSTKQKKLQRVPFRLRHKTSRKSCRIEPHVRLY